MSSWQHILLCWNYSFKRITFPLSHIILGVLKFFHCWYERICLAHSNMILPHHRKEGNHTALKKLQKNFNSYNLCIHIVTWTPSSNAFCMIESLIIEWRLGGYIWHGLAQNTHYQQIYRGYNQTPSGYNLSKYNGYIVSTGSLSTASFRVQYICRLPIFCIKLCWVYSTYPVAWLYIKSSLWSEIGFYSEVQLSSSGKHTVWLHAVEEQQSHLWTYKTEL